MSNKTIAVTGATGQQGSAAARRLLAEGWKVRALTRDTNKPLAKELAGLGAELVPGDMDKRAELDAAFKGADAVFSVQNYWLPTVGFEGEVRQGKLVVDAAQAAGTQHFVYSSVGAAHRGAGQKHFDSKYLIEQHLQASGLPYTILRPVSFMENFNFPWTRPYVLNGSFPSMGLRPEKTRQMVAVEDIAAFVSLVLAQPQKYLGQTIELAGDEQTEAQIAQTFSKVLGRPVTLAAPQGNGRPISDEMLAMNRFFNGEAYTADIPALRRAYPGLLTLEQYLRKNGWENAQPVPLPQSQGNWS
jgi:uncharacterized protein YbjT (DUF2867 family)